MRILGSLICSWLLLHCAAARPSAMAQRASASETKQACRAFVQRFYEWYVPKALHESGVPASDLALKYQRSVFSPDLIRALREDSEAQARAAGAIVGLDFDPFLNTQDPSSHYVVSDVMLSGNRCRADVYGVSSGAKSSKPDVLPELAFENGRWLFVNFHYGKSKRSNDENLLSILRTLREGRQNSPK